MIQEATIERTLERLSGGGEDFAQDLADFGEVQPFLLAYLTQEDTEAFTAQEQELLLFAAVVIYQSIIDELPEPARVEGEAIALAEEKNYVLLQEQQSRNFRERITVFFEQSTEEEILAVVEDLLTADEDSPISSEAREAMFVCLKTVMDTLLV
ncbi:MAG: hypothetical protein AAF433_13275 [Bacteroidota bacterium]